MLVVTTITILKGAMTTSTGSGLAFPTGRCPTAS
jgi:hypothetical protein